MLAEEYTENLFQSIDTIINERMRNLPYDQTIVAKILYVEKDSNDNHTGKYYLQSTTGPACFYAYGNLQLYEVGNVVYVRISGNDYNAQKIITGLYFATSTIDSTFTLNSLKDQIDSAKSTLNDQIESEISEVIKSLPSASVLRAVEAEKLVEVENNSSAPLNTGNEYSPVFISNGVPVATKTTRGQYAEYALKYGQVNSNNKITPLGLGETDIPIYIDTNGEFKACSAVSAYDAMKLVVDEAGVGDESTPVYFSGSGKPVKCTTVAAKTAETAVALSNTEKIGDESTPVYFSDGKPVECTTIVAETAKALSSTGKIGNESTPVYFSDGKPVECTTVAAETAQVAYTIKDTTSNTTQTAEWLFNKIAELETAIAALKA